MCHQGILVVVQLKSTLLNIRHIMDHVHTLRTDVTGRIVLGLIDFRHRISASDSIFHEYSVVQPTSQRMEILYDEAPLFHKHSLKTRATGGMVFRT